MTSASTRRNGARRHDDRLDYAANLSLRNRCCRTSLGAGIAFAIGAARMATATGVRHSCSRRRLAAWATVAGVLVHAARTSFVSASFFVFWHNGITDATN